MTIILQQPCPPHYWAHGPTVDSYDCIKCRESRAWNHPQHAEAAREYASYVTAVEPGESEDAPTPEPVEVRQEHREAAADQVNWLANNVGSPFALDFSDRIREGVWDNHHIVQAFARFDATRTAELTEKLGKAREALQAMMDTWLDYHDAHSLMQPVTGASANAFEKALAARDGIDAALSQLEDKR